MRGGQNIATRTPGSFKTNSAEALKLIECSPGLGRSYDGARKYRWVLLRKSHYLVFYEHLLEDNAVAIVAVWDPRRGEAPPLK